MMPSDQRAAPRTRSLGQHLDAEPDDAERAELHQHARVQHRDGGRRRDVAVGDHEWNGNIAARMPQPIAISGKTDFWKFVEVTGLEERRGRAVEGAEPASA